MSQVCQMVRSFVYVKRMGSFYSKAMWVDMAPGEVTAVY